MGAVEKALGEEIGQEYVAVHFPPSHKEKMLVLVGNLLEAYRESIESLDWMTEATRQKALEKLSKFVTKIGYPDKWRDFSALELVPGDLFENLRRTGAFDADWLIARKGQPVDKSEWLMTPQTVNAYYMPPGKRDCVPGSYSAAPVLQPGC